MYSLCNEVQWTEGGGSRRKSAQSTEYMRVAPGRFLIIKKTLSKNQKHATLAGEKDETLHVIDISFVILKDNCFVGALSISGQCRCGAAGPLLTRLPMCH